MNIDVDKIVVSLDVVTPDAVVVEASAVAPSGIVTEAVVELPTQVIVISHEETPTVTTLQIIDYGSSSIECAFDVTTEQAEEVVKGVLCGTINPPTFENADYRLLHGQGSMDLAFAGLQENTEYYLRPYALSNLGYKYGDVVSQRTKVNPIPDEYQLVEYLKSSGTQYILLQYIANNKSEVSFFYSNYDYNLSKSNGHLYGIIGDNWNDRSFGWCFSKYSGNNCIVYSRNNNIPLRSIPINNGQNSTGTVVIEKHNVFFNNEVVYYDQNASIFTAPGFLPLFTFSRNGSIDISTGCICIKLHYFKIIEDEINLISLYPVYRKADNKPGMYDIVNNQFYVNQGSGEFTVGPDTEWEE